jgi:dethiobiotin synthetase
MRARGLRVGVMKPFDIVESQDGQALALAVGSTLPMRVISPHFDVSTTALKNEYIKLIVRCFGEIKSQSDVVLVEAASRLDFPVFAAMLKLQVILVVGNRPGCIDAVKSALDSCGRWNVKVAGCILCDCEVDLHVDALDTPPGVPYLGRMRHREPLAKSIVEQLF